jgi:hypothetical protein
MSDKKDVLRLYGKYSVELARHLREAALTAEEQMYLENHLLIVQLALAMSKHARPKGPIPVRGE